MRLSTDSSTVQMAARAARPLWWLALGGALLLASSAAEAKPLRMLICVPGGPGSTQDAAERMQKFFDAFKATTQLELTGEYHTSEAACEKFMAAGKPDLALFPYRTFFGQRAEWQLVPVAQFVREGQGDNRYYLLANKGASLDSLQGAKLMSPHLKESALLSKVGFEGKVDLDSGFEAKRGSAIKAIKSLAKGKVSAIVLDEREYNSISATPFNGQFEVVLTSVPLPVAPLSVFGGDEKLAAKLRASLPGMCKSSPDACKPLEVIELKPAAPAEYDPLQQLLTK